MNTITIDRDVVEQALDMFERGRFANKDVDELEALCDALRAALEQPQVEQGPFAVLVRKNSWHYDAWEVGHRGNLDYGRAWADERINVYTHPQHPRQPLTEMEIVELRQLTPGTLDVQFVLFARAVERAHGIGDEK